MDGSASPGGSATSAVSCFTPPLPANVQRIARPLTVAPLVAVLPRPPTLAVVAHLPRHAARREGVFGLQPLVQRRDVFRNVRPADGGPRGQVVVLVVAVAA